MGKYFFHIAPISANCSHLGTDLPSSNSTNSKGNIVSETNNVDHSDTGTLIILLKALKVILVNNETGYQKVKKRK